MERCVRPGERYRHFKNRDYQIVAVAKDAYTGRRMVVYQALYGDFAVYVRPYADFISPVDKEKYPDAEQAWRFERLPAPWETGMPSEAGGSGGDSARPDRPEEPPAVLKEADNPQPSPAFLRFLEADTCEERLACLPALERQARQHELDSICLVLDMKPEPGSIREQVRAIRRFLTLQQKFDGSRLR